MEEKYVLLKSAVGDLISSLSTERIRQLESLVINHQITEAWSWYEMVISRYLNGVGAEGLIAEIDMLYPDESALKLIETSTDLPVFEAKVILREAQTLLRSSSVI